MKKVPSFLFISVTSGSPAFVSVVSNILPTLPITHLYVPFDLFSELIFEAALLVAIREMLENTFSILSAFSCRV